jgi:hypothetical protein
MNTAFPFSPAHFESLSPQQLQMLFHLMQPNAPTAAPAFPPTPGPDRLPANPYVHNIAQAQFGLPENLARPPVAEVENVHPNLEMASQVDSLRKELEALKSVLGQKRGVEDGVDDADDEGQVTAKKARKTRTKVVKRYITGVKNLSTHQATVRSELTVSLITRVGGLCLPFPRLL